MSTPTNIDEAFPDEPLPPAPDAPRKQVAGTHYNRHKIQPIDIIDEYGLDFYEGNALKYLLRRKGKGKDRLPKRREDLMKCAHYIEMVIARLK